MGDEKLNVGGEIYSLRPLTPLVVQVLANQKDLSFFISDGSERLNFHVPNDVTEVRETPEKVGRIARVTGWFSESEWVVLEFNDMSNKLVSARCKIPDRMVEFFHEHGDRHFDVHLQILRTSYSVKGKRPVYYYILDAEVFRDRLSRDEFFGRMENGQSRWFVPFPKDKQAGLQQKLC